MKIFNSDCANFENKKIKLSGWVNVRRDHGKIIFIDLRDRSGLVQLVFVPNRDDVYKIANKLRGEDVISIEGLVKKRPKGQENENIKSGQVEIEVEKIDLLAKSENLPFEISKDTKIVDEELRLKYRYLDLRSHRMQKNLVLRHRVIKFIRDYLSKKDFLEIETPILTKSTPEGARDYLVPSRLQPKKFYALPQSPQQYKQLLMVAGIERYFQIAKCFRDEDPRGDRQPEFTQLDLEMSFVTQDDILNLIEELFIKLVKEVTPEKKITQIPFPRLSFSEVMKKYKTDKPDLRKSTSGGKKDPNELAFAFIIDWPMFEWNKKTKRWDPYHHIFTSPKKEDLPLLDKDPGKVKSWQHDLVLNGSEVGGGSIRITDPKIQEKILELVGISKKEAQERFGHMLKAFEYGVPPHGGIAAGLDRFITMLANESSIREVIAFPKTGDARDLMMSAPSDVDPQQLKDLHLK
jgi:aspartyl-tRNA synthetase